MSLLRLALLALTGSALVGGAAGYWSAMRSTPTQELRVPRSHGAIVLDGDLGDSAWKERVARTGAFLSANGGSARPYSDARLLWGDNQLYVALYAADEDIRGESDSFHVVFETARGEESLDVSPLGGL